MTPTQTKAFNAFAQALPADIVEQHRPLLEWLARWDNTEATLQLLVDLRDLEPQEQVDEAEERWLEEIAKECKCCGTCWESPCGSCQQGSFCDAMPCSCDDEPEDGLGDQEDLYNEEWDAQ